MEEGFFVLPYFRRVQLKQIVLLGIFHIFPTVAPEMYLVVYICNVKSWPVTLSRPKARMVIHHSVCKIFAPSFHFFKSTILFKHLTFFLILLLLPFSKSSYERMALDIIYFDNKNGNHTFPLLIFHHH